MARYNRVCRAERPDDSTFIVPDENGAFHVVYAETVLFGSKQDRDDFEKWINEKGGDLFTEYQKEIGHDSGRED